MILLTEPDDWRQRIGGLLDPRVGCGVSHSFDATLSLLPCPLDNFLPFVPTQVAQSEILKGIPVDDMPFLLGYVGCQGKDRATVALVSDYGDPAPSAAAR